MREEERSGESSSPYLAAIVATLAWLLGSGVCAGVLVAFWPQGCQGKAVLDLLGSYGLDDLGQAARCPEALRWSILLEILLTGLALSSWMNRLVPKVVAYVQRHGRILGDRQASHLELVMAAWGHGVFCFTLLALWMATLLLFPHSTPSGEHDGRSGSFYLERVCLLLLLICLLLLVERVLMHAFLISYHRSVYGERVKANRFALWLVKCLAKAGAHLDYQPVRKYKGGIKALWRPRAPPSGHGGPASAAQVSAYLLEHQQATAGPPERELLLKLHDFLAPEPGASLREADLRPFFATQALAEQAFCLLDAASLGRLDAEGWCRAVDGVYEERQALLLALNTCTDMLRRLHGMNLFVIGLISLMVALALVGFSPRRALLPVGLSLAPLVAAASFMFGDSIKGLCAAMVYLLSSHPWDVGDRIYLEGYIYFVREVGLFSTRLERWDGHCVYLPNTQAALKAVSNVRRTGWQTQRIEIALPASTTAAQLQSLQSQLENFVRHEAHDFAKIRLSAWELRDCNQLVMILRVQHKWNFQEGWPRIVRVNKIMEAIRAAVEATGMARTQLPIKVVSFNVE